MDAHNYNQATQKTYGMNEPRLAFDPPHSPLKLF